jgi:hypothetical protein
MRRRIAFERTECYFKPLFSQRLESLFDLNVVAVPYRPKGNNRKLMGIYKTTECLVRKRRRSSHSTSRYPAYLAVISTLAFVFSQVSVSVEARSPFFSKAIVNCSTVDGVLDTFNGTPPRS